MSGEKQKIKKVSISRQDYTIREDGKVVIHNKELAAQILNSARKASLEDGARPEPILLLYGC